MNYQKTCALLIACLALSVGMVAASEDNSTDSEPIEENITDYEFSFEIVDTEIEEEQLDYEVGNDGVELSGTVEQPTPCHELNATVPEDEQYTLNIDSEEIETENDEACPQVVEYDSFEALFDAAYPYELTVNFDDSEMAVLSIDESGNVENYDQTENLNETEGLEEDVNETDTEEPDETEVNETEDTELNETDEELNETEQQSEDETDELVNETEPSNETEEEESPQPDIEIEEDVDETDEPEIELEDEETTEQSEEDQEETVGPEEEIEEEDESVIDNAITSVSNIINTIIPGR